MNQYVNDEDCCIKDSLLLQALAFLNWAIHFFFSPRQLSGMTTMTAVATEFDQAILTQTMPRFLLNPHVRDHFRRLLPLALVNTDHGLSLMSFTTSIPGQPACSHTYKMERRGPRTIFGEIGLALLCAVGVWSLVTQLRTAGQFSAGVRKVELGAYADEVLC